MPLDIVFDENNPPPDPMVVMQGELLNRTDVALLGMALVYFHEMLLAGLVDLTGIPPKLRGRVVTDTRRLAMLLGITDTRE